MTNEDSERFASQFGEALSAVIHELSLEVDRRALRLSKPRVLAVPEDVAHPTLTLLSPGCIVVFVFEQEHPLQSGLESALDQQDLAQIDAIAQSIVHRFRQPPREIARPIQDVPHIAEVRYGVKALASGIFIEQQGGFAEVFAYNGGPIEQEAFAIADYFSNNEVAPLASAVLIWPPPLSELEREALAQVPSELSEVNLSQGAYIPAPGILVAARYAYAAYTIGSFLYREYTGYRARQSYREAAGETLRMETPIGEEGLRALPPEAAARELLRVRREALQQQSVQLRSDPPERT